MSPIREEPPSHEQEMDSADRTPTRGLKYAIKSSFANPDMKVDYNTIFAEEKAKITNKNML